MQLKDQAAIVTGGASGLGAATARKLAAQGAKVAVFDLNAKLAESVAAELKGVAVACDVSDAVSAEAAIAQAAKAHGPARVLVNCAGIGVAKRVVGRDAPHPLADFERVIKINLIGSFNMLRLAASAMSKLEPLAGGERGVVINTASVLHRDGELVGWVDYRPAGESVIIAHTEVPAEHEGEGLGGELVRGAIERIGAAGKTVIPTCPFAAAYIDRHPELADAVLPSLRRH